MSRRRRRSVVVVQSTTVQYLRSVPVPRENGSVETTVAKEGQNSVAGL